MKTLIIFLLLSISTYGQEIQLKSGVLFPFVSYKSTTSTFYEADLNYKWIGLEYNQGFMSGVNGYTPTYNNIYKAIGLHSNILLHSFSPAYNPILIVGGGYLFVSSSNINHSYNFNCKYISTEIQNKTLINEHTDIIIGLKCYFTQTYYLDAYHKDNKYDNFINVSVGINYKFLKAK